MNQNLSFYAAVLLGLGIQIGLSGCGGGPGDQPDLGTVTGVITIDGQPKKNVMVYFNPEDGGRPSSGVSDEEGHYNLVYSTSSLGAKCGQHNVTITSYSDIDQNAAIPVMPSSEGDLPKGYVDIKKTVEVKPGKNVINLSYP